METSNFANWLLGEIGRRGWTRRELAKQSGLSESSVYMILNGQRGASLEFCVGVAQALEIRPEVVLQQAGLLPPAPPEVAEEAGLLAAFRRLSGQMRQAMVETIQNLARIEADERATVVAEGKVPYEPRSPTERLAWALARDLERLPAEDQELVFDLMRRLRGGDRREDDDPRMMVDPKGE